ncbi:KPN_02809 family neutral zinc metallopeptidase [Aurantivibrio infirmus]
MKWRNRRASRNVDDRRGQRVSRGRGRATKGGGILTIVIVLVAMYFGVDPRMALQFLEGGSQSTTSTAPSNYQATPEENQLAEFVSVVLADTEDVWHKQFQRMGVTYQEPVLVLFSGSVNSACGSASSAMGPFYCPADSKVYIDLSFYRDLRSRHGAPGDFAQAYVIAHEVGHHVQHLRGISDRVHRAKQAMSKTEANALSVRLELQADCLAGVWANNTQTAKQVLEQGDLEEALTAASAIGDDRLQKQATGRITPESFTHGTSEQRVSWFKKGFQTGSFNACDTFVN